MKKLFLLLILLCAIFCNATNAQKSPLWKGEGRIVISSDGNEHDDDDWSATPMSLAILKAAGLENKLTLYTYSDHVWGSSYERPNVHGMSAYDQMTESALGGKKHFGFKKTNFICAVDDAEKAYEATRKEINKSTAKNPLIIIGAGPMQVIGEAMNRADVEARKYVTLISHSNWNDSHADNPKLAWDKHSGWTWDMMKEAFESPEKGGAKFIHIKDQNFGWDEDKGLQCKRSYFDWLKTSPMKDNKYYSKGSWEWLYSRLEVCLKGKNKDLFDVSDSGMVVYILTGNEYATASDVRKIMENPKNPTMW